MVTRPSDGIPVGLSIVPYLVSYVRNTLVILTDDVGATLSGQGSGLEQVADADWPKLPLLSEP